MVANTGDFVATEGVLRGLLGKPVQVVLVKGFTYSGASAHICGTLTSDGTAQWSVRVNARNLAWFHTTAVTGISHTVARCSEALGYAATIYL